jgi:hypothetical protein
MAYIYGDIPFFECLVRREYTRNMEDGYGEFLPVVVHSVRCIRGSSLWFQTILTKQWAGCAFMVPIQALCWKECAPPSSMDFVQPWDCFSSHFTVVESQFVHRGSIQVFDSGRPPNRVSGQFRFTIDWTGSDLADFPDQHKHLHFCQLETGQFCAVPNNRILWEDPAFWKLTDEMPAFKSLGGEWRAEGNQHLFNPIQSNPQRQLEAAE